MVKNIWKSYIWTADKDVNESDPHSDVHYLGSSEMSTFSSNISAKLKHKCKLHARLENFVSLVSSFFFMYIINK